MIRRPPRSTRTDTLFPYTTLFRSASWQVSLPLPLAGGVLKGATPRRCRPWRTRSEEHTSELQSLMRISYAVFCLKKKTKTKHKARIQNSQCTLPSEDTALQRLNHKTNPVKSTTSSHYHKIND